MDRNELRAYCLSQKEAREDFPFGDDVAVFKVMNKVFALLPVGGTPYISLKYDPNLAVMLRETYPTVTPGYHLNKVVDNLLKQCIRQTAPGKTL